jgi:hypothetical protein
LRSLAFPNKTVPKTSKQPTTQNLRPLPIVMTQQPNVEGAVVRIKMVRTSLPEDSVTASFFPA